MIPDERPHVDGDVVERVTRESRRRSGRPAPTSGSRTTAGARRSVRRHRGWREVICGSGGRSGMMQTRQHGLERVRPANMRVQAQHIRGTAVRQVRVVSTGRVRQAMRQRGRRE